MKFTTFTNGGCAFPLKLQLTFCFFILSSVVWGQNANFYIGPTVSYHKEKRSRTIYGPGNEKRSSETEFFGWGVQAQKRVHKYIGLNIGLNHVKRHYDMKVPYNHCFDLPPGTGCTNILAHVNNFGYKTLEMPIGISAYPVSTKKFELYLKLNVVPAIDYQSYYQPSPLSSTQHTSINKEWNYFGTSVITAAGVGVNLTKNLKVNAEPFLRLVHYQRNDPIIITGEHQRRTKYDNFGAHMMLSYGF